LQRVPRVSLVLVVKNGLTYLPFAIDSVRAQTYRDFELVVQDAASTDGTVEYLHAIDDLPIELVSEPDRGHGDAYNRALSRLGGQIVGTIDADNLLTPSSLEDAVALIDANRGCAAIYGAVTLIDEGGTPTSTFTPGEWDLERFMRAELVPPFSTGYFVRPVCGEALRFDESIEWCQDYDLWLRLSGLPIVRTTNVLGMTRINNESLTCRPENYDQFCDEKIRALERFLAREGTEPIELGVRTRSVAGIYCWAAESVFGLEGVSSRFRRYVLLASELDPSAPRVATLRDRLGEDDSAVDPPERGRSRRRLFRLGRERGGPQTS
jgi:glycosyltransferase involved in cell wall biosynthesis